MVTSGDWCVERDLELEMDKVKRNQWNQSTGTYLDTNTH